jgi:hypothetical protein
MPNRAARRSPLRGRLGSVWLVAYNEASQAASLGNLEASPSLVYGARLLSGFGVNPPSCVRIALPPQSAASSTDRAPDYGSGGWGFESLAARTKSAGQRPGTGSSGAVGAPHCDQTATTLAGTANWTATTCDHHGPYGPHCCWSARPWRRHRWIGCGCCPFPTSMSGQCTGMHGHGRSAGWSPVMASVHHGMPVSRRVAKTPVRVELGASGPWEGWVAGSIPAGGSTSKGNRRAWGMGASARHRGLIRGHGRSVTGDTGNLKGSNVRSIVVAAHPRPSLTTGGLPPPQPSLLRSTRTPIVGILDKRSVSARSRQP